MEKEGLRGSKGKEREEGRIWDVMTLLARKNGNGEKEVEERGEEGRKREGIQ